MSYYPAPGAPYAPQQPVNPYGGMSTVGLTAPLPNTQMQQAQPQRPQPMNGQQPVQQSAQDGGWLLGRPVSSREVSLKAYGFQSLPYVSNTILGYLQFPHTHEFPSHFQLATSFFLLQFQQLEAL